MSELSNLASLARSKLQASVTNKDSSLHRWVLLKNSILQSQPITASVPAVDQSHINREEEYEDDDEEMDSFLFPDADKLFDNSEKDAPVSEAQWLDSLLETLVDEEGDELSVDGQVSALPADEDEDLCLSPLISPMSSSDDLLTQPVYSPPPISVPYPIPYSPVLHTYADDSSFEQPLASRSPPRHDDPVLPYYDIDDLEDLSVPDAIEDTSDDESDLPLTPSLRNSASSLPLQEPPPSSSPPARSRRAHPVVVSADNTYLDPFSLDPLPFAETPFPTYAGVYQDC